MAEKSIQAIQKEIAEAGYDWIAGENPVADLSEEEQSGLCGLAISDEELEATEEMIKAATRMLRFEAPVSLPAKVDWRNKGGDWTSPIRDQHNCGSCVAFGVLATVESRINIACKKPNLDMDLSECHLFYCGCGKCCNNGWNFAPALNFCKDTGMALESQCPYEDRDRNCPSAPIYDKIRGWKQVLTVQERKQILDSKGPMLGGMAVYSDFPGYKSGVYKKTPGAQHRGYHAISIVGYDDREKCWICKNSWGTSWGDNGWFKIGYGECYIDTRIPFYDIDAACKQVDECEKYKTTAIKYYNLYKKTKKQIYLCTYYRYAALYFLCKYKATKNRRYYCSYLKAMEYYYKCLHTLNCTKK